MTRSIVIASFLALLASIALAPIAVGQAVRPDLRSVPALKRSIIVSDELVRIGDLIDHAGALANVPIFRAPDLGMTGSVPTESVLEAIRPHHLFRVDVSDIAAVEVTRAGRSISPAEIQARVLGAFAGKFGLGEAKDLTLTIDQDVRSFTVEPTITGELQVVRAHYDPRTTRFEVNFALPGSVIARRIPLRFTGTLVEQIEVIVVARKLRAGDVIKAVDVMVERRHRSKTSADAVEPGEKIAGLAARRYLRAGQTLRRGDLTKPDLVKRDDTVTLVYEAPGMLLTTRGKATESGAEGDLISATNLQSRRTVQGIVTGPGRITLMAARSRILTAAASTDQAASKRNTSARGK